MIPSTILTLELVCQKITKKSLPIDVLILIYQKIDFDEWYSHLSDNIENNNIFFSIIPKGARKKKFKNTNCSNFRMKQAFRWGR